MRQKEKRLLVVLQRGEQFYAVGYTERQKLAAGLTICRWAKDTRLTLTEWDANLMLDRMQKK